MNTRNKAIPVYNKKFFSVLPVDNTERLLLPYAFKDFNGIL